VFKENKTVFTMVVIWCLILNLYLTLISRVQNEIHRYYVKSLKSTTKYIVNADENITFVRNLISTISVRITIARFVNKTPRLGVVYITVNIVYSRFIIKYGYWPFFILSF